jgi:hypothetical protein
MYDVNEILKDPVMREAIIHRLVKEEGWCRMRGDVDLVVRDQATGRIKGQRLVRNLVVLTGLYHIADRLQDAPTDEAAMGWAAIGTNNTAATATDTALFAEVGRVALTSKIQGTGGNGNQVTYSATVPAGTGTGTIVEAGLLNASSGGILLARSVFAPIVKGSGDAIDISWVLTISAA